MDRDTAKLEHDRLVQGAMSRILTDCVTCYACEEYCPRGNHPFYLIVERQESLGVHPVPVPIEKSQVVMMRPRGNMQVQDAKGTIVDMCFFSAMKGSIRAPLFEGVTTIEGLDVFCNLMYLHFARNSTIVERLPGVVDTIMRCAVEPSGNREVVCFHDECFGAFTSWAPAFGIDVPFAPVHLFAYLARRLGELKPRIKPLGARVAYQRPCSSRLCPETERYVDEIFAMVGVERPRRTYEYDDALCCAGVMEAAQRFDLADEVRALNIEDMLAANVQYCVFNCPFCFWTLAEPVGKAGIIPIMMTDLCLMALGG